jgi:hypothetical protein
MDSPAATSANDLLLPKLTPTHAGGFTTLGTVGYMTHPNHVGLRPNESMLHRTLSCHWWHPLRIWLDQTTSQPRTKDDSQRVDATLHLSVVPCAIRGPTCTLQDAKISRSPRIKEHANWNRLISSPRKSSTESHPGAPHEIDPCARRRVPSWRDMNNTSHRGGGLGSGDRGGMEGVSHSV